jgi:hypothetical protein
MRRREFIAGSIAVAAEKSVLPSSAWAQSAPRINRIIDAHCHVFNAADLPIEGFTKKIMVPKSAQTSELVARFADYPGALEALVHAITVHGFFVSSCMFSLPLWLMCHKSTDSVGISCFDLFPLVSERIHARCLPGACPRFT